MPILAVCPPDPLMLDSTFGGSYGVRIPDLPMLLKTTWVRTTSKQVKDAGGLKSLSSNRRANRWVGKPNLQSVLALTGSCVAQPHALSLLVRTMRPFFNSLRKTHKRNWRPSRQFSKGELLAQKQQQRRPKLPRSLPTPKLLAAHLL